MMLLIEILINTINITDDINGTTNALIGNSKPFMTIDQTL